MADMDADETLRQIRRLWKKRRQADLETGCRLIWHRQNISASEFRQDISRMDTDFRQGIASLCGDPSAVEEVARLLRDGLSTEAYYASLMRSARKQLATALGRPVAYRDVWRHRHAIMQ